MIATDSKDDTSSNYGIAAIKSDYLFHSDTYNFNDTKADSPEAKKIKLNGIKKSRGQNKNRYQANKCKDDKTLKLCQVLVDVKEGNPFPTCNYPGCKHLHDIKEYLQLKSPDLGDECPVFQSSGHCPRGVTCRFAVNHITEDGKNVVNAKVYEGLKAARSGTILSKDLQILLRKKKYNFSIANNAVAIVSKKSREDVKIDKEEDVDDHETENALLGPKSSLSGVVAKVDDDFLLKVGPICDEEQIKRKKKSIIWKDKLYLSPLTTLGNLPFRRICKEYGADVTCGEMAMAAPILQGVASEWALFRRHLSEDLFGVQLCGNNPHMLARCAQLIEENVDADFIDLNLGCPLEFVYQKGAGSGLLRREKQLNAVIRSMSQTTALPLTVKTRTGVYADKLVAHNLMPIFTTAGLSLITVHGRTREQRYTRYADWPYIEECAKLAAPTPVFGNGDILSYHDYNIARENSPHIAGVMIGRGALYKPWIFTEIKEQRDWDISSAERFEILKKFVHYGFEHWGSDTRGVENTRRFLLEWLSFLYRYIPVGLLERLPQRMNERPPRYVGRDDMETLMASANCADWVKISEMLCGPVPNGFQFIPKHRANAWNSD